MYWKTSSAKWGKMGAKERTTMSRASASTVWHERRLGSFASSQYSLQDSTESWKVFPCSCSCSRATLLGLLRAVQKSKESFSEVPFPGKHSGLQTGPSATAATGKEFVTGKEILYMWICGETVLREPSLQLSALCSGSPVNLSIRASSPLSLYSRSSSITPTPPTPWNSPWTFTKGSVTALGSFYWSRKTDKYIQLHS